MTHQDCLTLATTLRQERAGLATAEPWITSTPEDIFDHVVYLLMGALAHTPGFCCETFYQTVYAREDA